MNSHLSFSASEHFSLQIKVREIIQNQHKYRELEEGHVHGHLLEGLHLSKINNDFTICLVSQIFIMSVNLRIIIPLVYILINTLVGTRQGFNAVVL